MCQKKNCYVSPCTCCSNCYCNTSCFDVQNGYLSSTIREFHKSCDIRHKFVCFPCRRIWKSYTNKYILRLAYSNSTDLSDYVPNICNSTLTTKEKKKQKQKYISSWGMTDWGANFNFPEYFNHEGKMPKCAKCGNEALSVGRNFRHCKTEKSLD
jgi:hypothetical protein